MGTGSTFASRYEDCSNGEYQGHHQDTDFQLQKQSFWRVQIQERKSSTSAYLKFSNIFELQFVGWGGKKGIEYFEVAECGSA